ncbi:MAG: hypothetical protein J6T96_05525 [Bacteroidales bacterium]|nr:hypothetical protein [Bacteroidales bacterium]
MATVLLNNVSYVFPIDKDDETTNLKDGDLLICKKKDGSYEVGVARGASFYTENPALFFDNFGAKIAESEIVAVYGTKLWERQDDEANNPESLSEM